MFGDRARMPPLGDGRLCCGETFWTDWLDNIGDGAVNAVEGRACVAEMTRSWFVTVEYCPSMSQESCTRFISPASEDATFAAEVI